MITTRCLLYYKQSTRTDSKNVAFQYKQQAEEVADSLRNVNDEFLCHVLLRGRLEYINKWGEDPVNKKRQLEQIKKEAKEALEMHPRSWKLKEVEKQINYTYLSLAL